MAAPIGNQNAARKSRLLTSTLKRELTQRPDDVLAIANKLIESAKAGEAWAMTLIHDRVDGKVPQPIVGDDEESPIRLVTQIALVDLDASTHKAPPEA